MTETTHAPRWVPPPSVWEQPRRQRMVKPVVTLGSLSLLTLALRLRDPHHHYSWGVCPSAALGLYCPGCGGLRAVNDLTHGHPLEAASSNVLFVALLPFLVLGLAVWTVDRYRGHRREIPRGVQRGLMIGFLATCAVFMVLRNLPGSWLAP